MVPSDPDYDLAAIGEQLRRTQPWVRFLSIAGFVSAGFMILGGLAGGALGVATGGQEAAVLLFLYPLLGVLYIYPSLCLLRYGNAIRQYLASRQGADLVSALDAQRSFWKFAGVLTAISFAVTIVGVMLAVLVGILFGVASR